MDGADEIDETDATLQDTGNRENINPLGPGAQKHAGALLNGRACGENIIDQENFFPPDAGRISDLEGPADVLLAFGARELSLGDRRAGAHERRKIQGERAAPADAAGQKQGLVIPSGPQPLRVKGHRDYQVYFLERKIRVIVLRKQRPQRIGQVGDAAKFKAGDGLQEQALIRADRPRLVKPAAFCEAGGAEMIVAGIRPIPAAAPRAARMRDETDARNAYGAGLPIAGSCCCISAERTFRGKEEINELSPE